MADADLEPGYELDRIIAERVMGWPKNLSGDYVDGEGIPRSMYVKWWEDGRVGFNPSTDMNHAFEVMEKLDIGIVKDDAEWFALSKFVFATAPTAPLAICRLALKVVDDV